MENVQSGYERLKMYMPVSYTFSITNTRKKQIWLLACGLLLINSLLILFFALHNPSNYKILFVNTAIIFLIVFYNLFSKRATIATYRLGYFLVAIAWIKLDYYWLAILFSILFFLGETLTKDTTVFINKTDISLKNLFTKKYNWQSIKNIILKDGLLTIDFKNNKIFQSEIAEKISLTEENEFNDFCKKKLVV